MAGAVKRALSLVLVLLVGWVLSWLSLGLWQGDPTLLLRPGCPDWLKIPYLVSLYFVLVAGTAFCWRRYRPGWVSWGGPADWLGGFALGIGFLLIQRGVLATLGCWTPPQPFPWSLLGLALLTSPLLTWGEEWVFRGYFYGVLREEWGRWPAGVGVNLLFALVHLFRPGELTFKLALAWGLFLVGGVLTLALERRGRLFLPMGIHTAWVVAIIIDPPAQTVPGPWSGLHGESVTGIVSWLLLGVLAWVLTTVGKKN